MPLIKCKYVVIDGMPILLVEDLVPPVIEPVSYTHLTLPTTPYV